MCRHDVKEIATEESAAAGAVVDEEAVLKHLR
jgi:hypothetical protein